MGGSQGAGFYELPGPIDIGPPMASLENILLEKRNVIAYVTVNRSQGA
jgi:hypothetical protein